MNRFDLMTANPAAYALNHMPPRAIVDPLPMWRDSRGSAFDYASNRMAAQGYCYQPDSFRLTATMWAGRNIEEQRMSRIRAYAAGRDMVDRQAIENAACAVPSRLLGPSYRLMA